MDYFIGGILLLIAGYCIYGRFIERILAPDDRVTPAVAKADGVDYVILPHWKNMLIQLLNIAGIGPVIGVILGIRFGVIVFLIIPIGNIIGGAVHDFIGGMMSMRRGGENLPGIIREHLGVGFYYVFLVFMSVLLLLVVAVFINVPANLIAALTGSGSRAVFWWAVLIIFIYYVCATLFPVDKIIGKFYPIFGLMLLLGSVAIFGAIVKESWSHPELLTETPQFVERMWTAENSHPILPLLFVTIACGIISGFHATQSPIIVRTMKSEREARSNFYGMMIVEGIIGMIWAGAGLVIYNLYPELMTVNPNTVLAKITEHFLGPWIGGFTIIAVVILAITSGDTALRSLRLSFAEALHYEQKKLSSRIILVIPLIVIVSLLLFWSNTNAKAFNNLWNYFAWSNQVLAVCTLFAGTIWLRNNREKWFVAAIPGTFMAFIVISYILWISPAHGGPVGFGMELETSYYFGCAAALLMLTYIFKNDPKKPDKN